MSSLPIIDPIPVPPLSPTVAFVTLGCKTNLLESSALAGQFQALGWQVTPQQQAADLYVFNTCTVTERADSEARRLIRQIKRKHPSARIAVTGCYAQVAPQELAAIDGVDLVIGNNLKDQLARLVVQDHAGYRALTPGQALVLVDEFDKSRELAQPVGSAAGLSRSRGAVKIQDGCDYKCTYCIIWQGRGPSRSLPVAATLQEIQRLAEQGYQEIALNGINIGQYDHEGTDLAGLLRRIAAVPGQFRVRLTSLDPLEVTPELITAVAESDGKVCSHFHLSTQSAHDGVLKAMARRHHVADLETVCRGIVEAMPHAHIASDVIVGFPMETAEAFEQTVQVLDALPMHSIHVFRYSPRPGTPAAGLRPQVPDRVRKERAQRLIALADGKKEAFYQQAVGQTRPVVLEEPLGNGTRLGWTDNYLRVQLAGADHLPVGSLASVDLLALQQVDDSQVLTGILSIQ